MIDNGSKSKTNIIQTELSSQQKTVSNARSEEKWETTGKFKKSEVTEMIDELHKLKNSNSIILSAIKNFDLLIVALKELDSLIEMEAVKKSIISQLRFLIIKQLHSKLDSTDSTEPIFEDHMLHTVIYGPAGSGKTNVGTILAKIWMSLMLIHPNAQSCIPSAYTLDGYDIFITKLEQRNKEWLGKLEMLQQQMLAQQDCYNTFDKEIKKLSENNRFISTSQKDLIKITFTDALKYLEIGLKIISDEINREKPHVSDKFIGSNLATNIINTETLVALVKKLKPTSSNTPTSLSSTSNIIKVVSRPDFVAEYLGQTAIKTLDLLKNNLGKVLFIDEAYSLINSDRDSYGMEALTVLNQFMSEHPHEIVIIFAGYKDLLERTVFERQPGLKRRCTWVFEVNGYTPEGLSRIFRKQMQTHGWTIDPKINLIEFFSQNKDYFPSFGGDTSKFSFYCKLAFANTSFTKYIDLTKRSLEEKDIDLSELSKLSLPDSNSIQKKIPRTNPKIIKSDTLEDSFLFSKSIDLDILKSAFTLYKENRINENLAPSTMYI